MHLVKPVDVVSAGLAPWPIAPVVVEVVGVPLVDALEVSKKSCLADRYLFIRSADKPEETFTEGIHEALRVKRRRRRTPGSATVQPKSCTRAPIRYCSVAETSTCGGQPETLAAQRFSVVDTVAQARCGVFVGSIREKTSKDTTPGCPGVFFLDITGATGLVLRNAISGGQPSLHRFNL